MNPAALKANVSDLPRGGLIIANSDEFTKRNLGEGRLRGQPARRRRTVRLRRAGRPDDDIDAGRRRGDRCLEEGRPARQEHVRPRAVVVDVRPGARAQRGVHPREVRPQARRRRGQRAGAESRLELRGNHRGVRHHLCGIAGQAAPASTGRSPATPHWRTASSRRSPVRHPGRARQLPDHGLRHPARTVQAQELQRPHLPGRGRDRRHRRGTVRPTAVRWASPARRGRVCR